jgi:hypothetical protein
VAQAATEAHHGGPVGVRAVEVADLDRDGHATDLIVAYFPCGPHAECADPRFLVAKGAGFTHAVLATFTQFNEMTVLNGLVIGSIVRSDFPTSTIFGYQGGKLEALQDFARMLEYGKGADEAVEAFDLIEIPGGLRARAPGGLFDILWNAESGRYAVTQLGWPAAIDNDQYVLYVRRPPGAMKIDAAVMLNDRKVAGAADLRRGATISVSPQGRIVFDPVCLVKDGFKRVDKALGAVILDPAAPEHVFACVLYPGAIVTVRVEHS